jgi:hypothetical protein
VHSQFVDDPLNCLVAIVEGYPFNGDDCLFNICEGYAESLNCHLFEHVASVLLQSLRFNVASKFHMKWEDAHLLDIQHTVLLWQLELQPFFTLSFDQIICLVLGSVPRDIPQYFDKVLRHSNGHVFHLNGDLFNYEVSLRSSVHFHNYIY